MSWGTVFTARSQILSRLNGWFATVFILDEQGSHFVVSSVFKGLVRPSFILLISIFLA